jgi:hypothetical protein
MDAVLSLIAILAGLLGFDLAAVHFGADSRDLANDAGPGI